MSPQSESHSLSASANGAGQIKLSAHFWAVLSSHRLLFSSILVGLGSGLAAVAFLKGLEFASHIILEQWMGLRPPAAGEGPSQVAMLPTRWWLVLMIPTIGGFIAGGIVQKWAPEAAGDGTDALVKGFHKGEGKIRLRVPLVKGLASIITIATGGSAAQEGPTAQIGAGLGSWLGTRLGLPVKERRLVMLAGAAGGLGAIFRAPLGGALYVTEVLYSTTASESAALLPCVTSSIVAYSVFASFVSPEPVFRVPDYTFHGLSDLGPFTLLGLLCVPVGWLFVKVFHYTRDPLFTGFKIPNLLKPALGGLAVGLIGLVFPQILAGGYGWVQWGALGEPHDLLQPGEQPFVPNMGFAVLLTLALVKIVATSLTIGSGGSGGVFGPSIFVGGMLGGAFGQVLAWLFPGASYEPGAFVLVGMGGFFAGVSKAPLASILMICELTNSYSLLVPLMLVCGLHLGLSTRWSLYHEQVPSPVDSLAHEGDFTIDLLEQTTVSEVPLITEKLVTVQESLPIDSVLTQCLQSDQETFPLMNSQMELTGIIRREDLYHAFGNSKLGPLVLAAELAIQPSPFVVPGDEVLIAMIRMNEIDINEIPVIDSSKSGTVIGLLSRSALTETYIRRIRQLRGPSRMGSIPGSVASASVPQSH
ncbi:chloride channel protein [Schlesneria sp. T3-172]|uniref:chloride channel protein n=1 Tax=Schlesneria sphaerica TaxID=3373610 RepID=UPI0037C6FC8E